MKKILFILVSALVFCTSNIFATNRDEATSTQINLSQVCQFSLNHYTGEITWQGYTKGIIVGLNCPQTNDVHATVFVYIDDELVASQIFTISEGEMQSRSSYINVGSEYEGKKYTLRVE